MLLPVYRCILRLHPAGFRNRFGDEMLSIFDEAQGRRKRLRLIFDCVSSVVRQWMLRPEFWSDTALSSQPAADGIPLFGSLDPFRPRTTAVIQGMLLSITLFSLTCFAIRYSWIHVLQVRIPEVQFENFASVHPSASPSELRGKTAPETDSATQADPSGEGANSGRMKFEVLPVEAPPEGQSTKELDAGDQQAAAPGQVLEPGAQLELHLEAYAGRYISRSPVVAISIDVRGANLTMTVADQPTRTLSPISETAFVLDGDASHWVRFEGEHRRRFQRLHLFQDGQEIVAKRQ